MADSKSERVSASPSLEVHERLVPIIGGLKSLYSSKAFSDLVVTCKGQKWDVHKAVVCLQSAFFEKACNGEFKEAIEGKVPLEEDDPQVVDAMLYYLYNFDYGDHGNSQEDAAPIVLDVRMFAIADKFAITPLKKLAAKKFAVRADAEWNTAGFAEAIAEVYDIIPAHEDTLERIVVRVVKQHAKELFDESNGFASFRKVVRETGECGDDIASALAAEKDHSSTTYQCPSCGAGNTFTVNVPSGVCFGCPNNHYGGQNQAWWSNYVEED